MIPKINFRYSWIYDERFKPLWKKKHIKKWGKYPSYKEIKTYIKKIKPIWKKQENKVLKELSELTNLEWKEKEIKCYITGRAFPFSDPLTMRIYKNKNFFIDCLIHELIHVLFIQNTKETNPYFAYIITKKYKNEKFNTRIHIPVHAIHKYIFLKFFTEKRLKTEIDFCKYSPEYKRSWEIVNSEGYENIIKEFRKRIK